MRLVGERPVVERQREHHRAQAEADGVELGDVQVRRAARRVGGRAVDHRHAERAQREDRRRAAPSRCGGTGVVRTRSARPAPCRAVTAVGSVSGWIGPALRRQRPAFLLGEERVQHVLRDRRGVRRRERRARGRRRPQSAGCRAARRTTNQPWSRRSLVGACRRRPCPAFEITCAVPVLPGDVVRP